MRFVVYWIDLGPTVYCTIKVLTREYSVVTFGECTRHVVMHGRCDDVMCMQANLVQDDPIDMWAEGDTPALQQTLAAQRDYIDK